MNPNDRFATSGVGPATVHIIAPERLLTDAHVEYCVSSGYVRAITDNGHTVITHISNVVIEVA